MTSPAVDSSDTNGYPVMVWIHGGSFLMGSGGSALYNATHFALNGFHYNYYNRDYSYNKLVLLILLIKLLI